VSAELVVVVPAAGGGDGVPGACLAELGGRPLLDHTLEAAAQAPGLARVAVATADTAVGARARAWGAAVLDPGAAAGDDPASDDAFLAAIAHECTGAGTLLAVLDPWFPLRRAGRLAEACDRLRREEADSLMAVCASTPRLWRRSPGGLVPFHDPRHGAPRAGAPAAWLRETGALYLCRADGLTRHRQRLFGRIATLETHWTEALRADDATGLAACRALLAGADGAGDEALAAVAARRVR